MNALWLLFPAAAKFGHSFARLRCAKNAKTPKRQERQNAKNAKTPRTPKRQERQNAKNAETPRTPKRQPQ